MDNEFENNYAENSDFEDDNTAQDDFGTEKIYREWEQEDAQNIDKLEEGVRSGAEIGDAIGKGIGLGINFGRKFSKDIGKNVRKGIGIGIGIGRGIGSGISKEISKYRDVSIDDVKAEETNTDNDSLNESNDNEGEQ